MSDRLHAHLRGIARGALGHAPPTPALVLYDTASPLARRLEAAWRAVLPHATCVDVDVQPADVVFAALDALPRRALVVLVQSTRFRLREFRFRIELFKRGLAVVELPHLARIADDEIDTYVDALAVDPAYLRPLGRALHGRLATAREVRVHTADGTLELAGPFEPATLNVGDYAGMPNVGGQFPIGEVFTEPVDLDGVAGVVTIAAFGADDFTVVAPDPPFALAVRAGRVVGAPRAPAAFAAILATIAADEGEVRLRELGFGLNRAMTLTRRVRDVGTFERMCGVHLSLGAKHPVYPKPGFSRRRGRHHVDVFVAVERVEIDGAVVYADGAYTV